MAVFDDPDITILTPDFEVSMALARMANSSKDAGDTSFELYHKLQKSLTPERIHEVWIIVNDLLESGALITGIYTTLKAVEGFNRKELSLRFGARLHISRDDQERLESLGCELIFEKDAAEISLPSPNSKSIEKHD